MPQITSWTLSSRTWGAAVGRILSAALQSADPGIAVERHMQRQGNSLLVGGESYDLGAFRRILMIGVGKAAVPMATTSARMLGDKLSGGIIITKTIPKSFDENALKGCEILQAGHPVPDENSVTAARRILALLEDTTPDDLVICLISGGGSALLVSPAEGISLADLRTLTEQLLACGAPIEAINTLRKHTEQLKGGGLARSAYPAQVITLILSDVVGNPLDVIASGPTVPDPTTFEQAHHILRRYHLWEAIPEPIRHHLEEGFSGNIPETPKPGDPVFDKVYNLVVGDSLQAAQAAIAQAQTEGLHTLLLTTYLQGEARHAGRFLASIARQISTTGQPIPPPAMILAGGETTVTLSGNGLGGRNQELALGAVQDIAGFRETAVIALATDGEDGPTDAAGAIASGETLERATQSGLDAEEYLARNDSYNFFKPLGDLLMTGPTQTNVKDLYFVFVFDELR